MAKENTILAIDVGGDSLKMAEFVVPPSGGTLALSNYAISEYDESVGETDFLDRFLNAYRRMLAEHKFKSKQVRVTISGQHTFSRLSKLPPLTEKQEQIVQIIEFEAKQTVPYPMNEVVWSYQLIRHSSAGYGSMAQPDATTGAMPSEYNGDQDELEALFVAVKSDLVSGISDVIQDSGKDILSIEMAPTAIFNAAKANHIGDNGCEIVLNIGGRCSCLVFVDQGRIYVRTIPIAGDTITQQIAKEFNITFSDAEALKRRHCFVALGGAYEEPDSETAATISKIARNVMTRLHGEIHRSINQWRSQYEGNKPVRMLLCGGSSIIQYAPHFFCEKLNIPVGYLNVFPVVDLKVDKEALLTVAPLFPELIGLGLRHVADCPIQISLMPLSIKRHEILQKKKPYLYASAISAVLCLIVFYWLVSQRKAFDRKRVELTGVKVQETEKRVNSLKEASGKLQQAGTAYQDALDLLAGRNRWFAILNELQRLLPDQMWFTKIEGAPAEMDPMMFGGMGGGMGGPGGMMGGPMGGSPVGGGMMGGGPMGGGMDSGMGMMAETLPDYEWIVLEGHSLIMDQAKVLPEDIFRERVLKSELFDATDAESFKYEYLAEDKGENNLTSFKVKIKLKEPIKQ